MTTWLKRTSDDGDVSKTVTCVAACKAIKCAFDRSGEGRKKEEERRRRTNIVHHHFIVISRSRGMASDGREVP
jgi:hypothetical protein